LSPRIPRKSGVRQLMMGWASPARVLRHADVVAPEIAAAKLIDDAPIELMTMPPRLEIHGSGRTHSNASRPWPVARPKQWHPQEASPSHTAQ
jgi:hypothetical protein